MTCICDDVMQNLLHVTYFRKPLVNFVHYQSSPLTHVETLSLFVGCRSGDEEAGEEERKEAGGWEGAGEAEEFRTMVLQKE